MATNEREATLPARPQTPARPGKVGKCATAADRASTLKETPSLSDEGASKPIPAHAHRATRPNGRREDECKGHHSTGKRRHRTPTERSHATPSRRQYRRTQRSARNATKVLTTDTMPKGKPFCAPMVAHHARGAHLGGGGCSNVMETPQKRPMRI